MNTSRGNSNFWNEVCGTHLANSIGVDEVSDSSFSIFDAAFYKNYPFLERYVAKASKPCNEILEVGLGYGSLFSLLTSSSPSARYTGIDIAEVPVELMRKRISSSKSPTLHNAHVASVLELPFSDNHFDNVFALGSLHHTGNTQKAIEEVHRVLRDGGTAIVMLYNRRGVTRIKERIKHIIRRVIGRPHRNYDDHMRWLYDHNSAGDPAPHTDFYTVSEAKSLFAAFSQCKISKENAVLGVELPLYFNCGGFEFSLTLRANRQAMSRLFGQWMGDNIYIVATK